MNGERIFRISREISREKPKINDFPENFPGKANVERIFKIVTLD